MAQQGFALGRSPRWLSARWRILLSAVTLALVATSCSAFDAPLCSGFDDELSEGTLVVRAHNRTALPLYFVAPSDLLPTEPFTLQHDGESVSWVGSACSSCEAARHGASCALIGGVASVVEVPPESHHDFEWDRTIRRQRRLPNGCGLFVGNEGLCEQAVLAPAGDYSVTLTAFTQQSCQECECSTVFSGGSCLVQNSTPAQAYGSSQVDVAHPGSDLVEVIFE